MILAKIFGCNVKSMRYTISRMYKNKKDYLGFDMEKEIMTSTQCNDYIRYVYFVK